MVISAISHNRPGPPRATNRTRNEMELRGDVPFANLLIPTREIASGVERNEFSRSDRNIAQGALETQGWLITRRKGGFVLCVENYVIYIDYRTEVKYESENKCLFSINHCNNCDLYFVCIESMHVKYLCVLYVYKSVKYDYMRIIYYYIIT